MELVTATHDGPPRLRCDIVVTDGALHFKGSGRLCLNPVDRVACCRGLQLYSPSLQVLCIGENLNVIASPIYTNKVQTKTFETYRDAPFP